MWVAKFRVKHACVLASRCEKFGVECRGIVLNTWQEGGKTLVSSLLILGDAPKNIQTFLEDLEKDRQTRKIERVNENTIAYLNVSETGQNPSAHFDPKLFFLQPVFMDKTGHETWDVGAWEKATVTDFLEKVRKRFDEFELLGLSESKLDKLFYRNVLPDLTDTQQRVFNSALHSGYYEYPRKIHLRRLAKNLKLSLATVQEHLRKAEAKLLAAK